MRKVISVWVQNAPGVLAHISGLLAARGFNVDSLTVGATEDPRFSRMTIVLDVEESAAAQIKSQLQKIVTVVETSDLSSAPYVERELALVRVEADATNRSSVVELAQIFRGSIVDVAARSLLVEISGSGDKLDAFVKALYPLKIVSMTRSGCIAARRGDSVK